MKIGKVGKYQFFAHLNWRCGYDVIGAWDWPGNVYLLSLGLLSICWQDREGYGNG